MATHILHEDVRGTRFEAQPGAKLTEVLNDMRIELHYGELRAHVESLSHRITAVVMKLPARAYDRTHAKKPVDGSVMFFVDDQYIGVCPYTERGLRR